MQGIIKEAHNKLGSVTADKKAYRSLLTDLTVQARLHLAGRELGCCPQQVVRSGYGGISEAEPRTVAIWGPTAACPTELTVQGYRTQQDINKAVLYSSL